MVLIKFTIFTRGERRQRRERRAKGIERDSNPRLSAGHVLAAGRFRVAAGHVLLLRLDADALRDLHGRHRDGRSRISTSPDVSVPYEVKKCALLDVIRH